MQKLLLLALCAVIAFFQYELWYGKGGIYDSRSLQTQINQQLKINQQLQKRNDEVFEHLEELKGVPELIEARARRELNLVKPNEILVLLPDSAESALAKP